VVTAVIKNADRLTLACGLAAARHGATLANYVDAIEPLRAGNTVGGMRVREAPTGSAIDVLARVTGNAAEAVARSRFLELAPPEGALYAFIGVRLDRLPDFDDQEFALDLLEHKHVLVAPGSSFNVPYRNYFRITNLPEPRVLAVGRLQAQKGFDLLLQAWQTVNRQLPEARLRIVGGGPLEDELAALARSLGVEASVEFVAPTEQIEPLYSEAAVFVLSITMVLTSLTLDWHWFADLLAGLLVGSVVLQLTATVDTWLPPNMLHRGPLELLRSLRPRAGAAVPSTDPTARPRQPSGRQA
jgi:glycosyltransferase involved in cell wall biosynthesis